MHFAWLTGLYLLVVLGGAVWLRRRWRRGYFGHSLLSYVSDKLGRSPLWIYLPRVLEVVGVGLLFVALLDPVIPFSEHEVRSEGLDIVLIIDLSSSMQLPVTKVAAPSQADLDSALADPSKPFQSEPPGSAPPKKAETRLAAAKKVLVNFINQRRRDRLGLVVFSTNAYIVSPLTTDYRYLVNYVQMINDETLSNEGMTAIGEGLYAASELLLRQNTGGGRRGKVMVLLTDGENNYGRDIYQALQVVKEERFKVYFIGIEVQYLSDVSQLIAAVKATGGRYYDARDLVQLQQAYREINALEKGIFLTKTQVRDAPAYFPFVLAALISLAGGMGLRVIPYFRELS